MCKIVIEAIIIYLGRRAAAAGMAAAPGDGADAGALRALGPPYHAAVVKPVSALDESVVVAPAAPRALLLGVDGGLADVVRGGGHHRRHLRGGRSSVRLPETLRERLKL